MEKNEPPEANLGRNWVFFRLLEVALLAVFNLNRLLVAVLPPEAVCAMARGLGELVYRLHPRMRRKLLDTLRGALPEIEDQRELERLAARICSSPIMATLELIIFHKYRDEMLQRMEIEGMEHLDRADERGKGVIIFAPHIGGFALAQPLLVILGKGYAPVILNPAASPVPRYILSVALYTQRIAYDRNLPVFWAGGKDVVPRMRRHLEEGKRIGMTIDVEGGSVLEFFGQPTSMTSGIGHFALDTGAAIIPVTLLRTEDPLKYRLTICEPLAYELTGDRKQDLKNIMDAVVACSEDMIRRAPEQWMGWFGLPEWRKRAQEILAKKAEKGS